MSTFKNYSEALQHLYLLGQKGVKLGLQNMHDLLKTFHHPEKNLRVIHVAGTNGKGSVTTKIAKGLELAGFRVGLYTSPHISTFRERIQINGDLISEESVLRLLIQIGTQPGTFFEITTLLAWLYFAEQHVDYVVLETGLGGRLDATNTITPLLAIITSISYDHTEILGNSLEAIAAEKAGIIKPNVPVLIGPRVPLEPIIAKGSPWTQVEEVFKTFDDENRAIAKKALEMLVVPAQGLEALPPCRMQEIPGFKIPILLDVAHNSDGLRFLFESLSVRYEKRAWQVICGLSANKDLGTCLKILQENSAFLHLVQAEHERAAPLSSLTPYLTPPYQLHNTIQKALQVALQGTHPLLICGSFFLMADVREALSLPYPRDPIALHEKMGAPKTSIV